MHICIRHFHTHYKITNRTIKVYTTPVNVKPLKEPGILGCSRLVFMKRRLPQIGFTFELSDVLFVCTTENVDLTRPQNHKIPDSLFKPFLALTLGTA